MGLSSSKDCARSHARTLQEPESALRSFQAQLHPFYLHTCSRHFRTDSCRHCTFCTTRLGKRRTRATAPPLCPGRRSSGDCSKYRFQSGPASLASLKLWALQKTYNIFWTSWASTAVASPLVTIAQSLNQTSFSLFCRLTAIVILSLVVAVNQLFFVGRLLDLNRALYRWQWIQRHRVLPHSGGWSGRALLHHHF